VYRLEVSPAADGDLQRLKRRIQRRDFDRLRTAIRSLGDEPRPHGVRRIEGAKRAYWIGVGDYRIVYEVYDKESLVLVLQVAQRTETTYRRT